MNSLAGTHTGIVRLQREGFPAGNALPDIANPGASPRGCILPNRIPPEVQALHRGSKRNAPRRIPILYVLLRILAYLGAVFEEAKVAE
jgi:hypothetical protein